jgi:hypothetical protein
MKNIFKYIILEQLLTENRVQQAKDKYPCIPPQLVDYLVANDPSGNNKYLDWMCKQVWDAEDNNEIIGFNWDTEVRTLYNWLDNHGDSTESPYCQKSFIESYARGKSFNDVPVVDDLKNLADAIIEEVKFFNRFVNALPVKDINRYNYNSLRDALANKKLQAQEKEYAKDVTKIYEDNEWLLVSPKTHQSSCAYGANTKWCVTMKGDPSYYKNYTSNGEYLIFVINKAKNDKWAVHTSVPLNTQSEDVEINLPWHKEVRLSRFPSPYLEPQERYRRLGTGQKLGDLYKSRGGGETNYYDAEDDNISRSEFIQSSNLPEKLQQLLNFLEKRFKVSMARKKKTDIPYEINQEPVRLRKGDKVKLLASGYGYIRGDEGYVIATYSGASGRNKELYKNDAGVYTVYVPHRLRHRSNPRGTYTSIPADTVVLKTTDKIISKLDLKPGDDFKAINDQNGRTLTVNVYGININGVYLKKI